MSLNPCRIRGNTNTPHLLMYHQQQPLQAEATEVVPGLG